MSKELVKGLRKDAKILRQKASDIPIFVPEGDPIMDLQTVMLNLRKQNNSVMKTLSDLYKATEFDIDGADAEVVEEVREKVLAINGLLSQVNKITSSAQVKLNILENSRLEPTEETEVGAEAGTGDETIMQAPAEEAIQM